MINGFTERDDAFHFDQMTDRWWETETCWFSFCEPERKLGGWLYVMVRPNIGTVAGGAWVWDHTTSLPWDVLYSTNYTTLRLPPDADLRDVELPTGVRIKVIKPLSDYAIGYHDGPRLQIDLRFSAVMKPFPLAHAGSSFGQSHHFDQVGHVTGVVTLHGEPIEIDCLAMRDRSWGPRVEHRPRQTSYVSGVADPEHGFLALCGDGTFAATISHGFLLRDGEVSQIASGRRLVERDHMDGRVRRIRIESVDEQGRVLTATGEPISRIIINRHTMIDSNSLLRWEIDGAEGWGEDQDLWPVHQWADFRRSQRRVEAAAADTAPSE